jgi:predicted transglutaminase-like cysteine proteinase
MSSVVYDVIYEVFREVYSKFTYQSDSATYQTGEFWECPEAGPDGRYVGDCEDFALLCYKGLTARGRLPRLATCRTEMCPPDVAFDHCVCTDEEDGEVYVLDCRYPRVNTLRHLPGYTGWRRQNGKITDPWECLQIGTQELR